MPLILPGRWPQQPQIPAPINRANPLTLGLTCVLHPATGTTPIDPIGYNAFAPQGGTTQKSAPGGSIGWDVATAGTDGLQLGSSLAAGYPITFGAVFVPGTLGTNVNLVNVANSAVANTSSRLGLRVGTSTVDAYSANSSGTTNVSSSPNAPTVGVTNAAIGVFASNASRKVYLNGIAGTVNSTATVVSSLTNTCVGSAVGTTRQNGQVGQYLLVLVWNRALSDAEAISFTRDPWQVFRAAPRRIAAPDFTGTFASTLAGASMAASGQVTDAGSAASTLGGVSMAASGLISVPGVFASTLDGVSMSASGSGGSVLRRIRGGIALGLGIRL